MTTDLEHWQARLERHFSELAAGRNTSAFPLFALEHGLSADELGHITRLLHSSLAGNHRLSRHWLVWVVYATELGYDYDGDEYWETFETRTPLWRERAARGQLRAWFAKFSTTCQGVKPTGSWADFFSIIAWPITHAILPKYLQLQLARTLFSLRYHLAGLETFEATAVGRLLASSAWDASSRFAIFLQQQELVGRIVLALLASKKTESPSPILSLTLQRLADDLGHARNAREWLRETRSVVADRFEGTGRSASKAVGRWSGATGSTPGSAEVPPANIRASLLLRRSSATAWSVFVEIAGFASLSRLNADLRTFLRATRCRVRGTGDTWLPAGWVLAGSPRRILKNWPGSREPILAFERANGQLEHLLQSECRLSNGLIWLFRIGEDDIAREVVGRFVRCKRQYLIIGEKEMPSDPPLLSRCELSCEGVIAYHLSMPEQISAVDIARLEKLGLHVARTIRMWPAGLLSRGWDGEGHAEWLTTETPCFGIVHDHRAEAYSLRLNKGPEIIIPAKAPGVATFVQLPRLPAGRHVLTAAVRRQSSEASLAMKTVEGLIAMDVRDPAPWIPGTTSHVGMSVVLDPHDPTLDELWNEDVDLSVQGPTGYHAHCSMFFLSANGTEIASGLVGSFDFPISANAWARKLHEFVKNDAYAWAYAEAASGKLTIRGDELGEYRLRLEREVKPIRWACKRTRDSALLRLIDESGRDEPATIGLFAFDQPLKEQAVPAAQVVAGIACAPPGGLFTASKADHFDAIIVSSPHVEGGLQGLAAEVDLARIDITGIDVKRTLRSLDLWMKTRLVGPLAGLRRDRAVRGLCQLLYARLCGARWARAEDAFLDDPQSKRALDALVESVDRSPSFAIVLQRDHGKTEGGTIERTRWSAAIASQFRVCTDVRLIEFALKLAGQPHKVLAAEEKEFDTLLRQVSEKTVLLRGARLLALLAVAKRSGGPGSAIPRWTWRS